MTSKFLRLSLVTAVVVGLAVALPVRWHRPPDLPDMSDLPGTLRDQPATPRRISDTGDFDRGMAESIRPLTRSYLWPYHLHGSIGPSCAVADWNAGRPLVWSGTQNPHMLRDDLAVLAELPPDAIEVRRQVRPSSANRAMSSA